MQMINHGIYSGALFLLVGIISYAMLAHAQRGQVRRALHVMPGYVAIFLGTGL